ncbi:MAG: tetratricopeptide repeat protein, partial [Pseudomonadota bacterium]
RDFAKAVADYSRLVQLMPENADAYNNRGYAYHQLGDRARAIADYRKALELNPALVQPRENLKALGIGS